jgi:hypothetical protein
MPMTAPYQSKLIPHEEFIRRCRAKRWSYPRIAAALLEEHGINVGSTTIFDFVKVWAQKRRAFELPPAQEAFPSNPALGFFEPPASTPPKNEPTRRKYKLDQ